MQGAVHLGAIILASLGVACAPTLDVSIQQTRDLSGLRTWSFLAPGRGNVRAPEPDTAALDAVLTHLIGRCLLERGFTRVMEQPDFRVGYVLEIRRQIVNRVETPAMETLSSLHDSPSYEIQISEQSVEIHDRAVLTIFVSDPGDQAVTWRGEFVGLLRGPRLSQLTNVVASVLRHFPVSDAARAESPASEARVRVCAGSWEDLRP
jgi:hypothetical protein